MPNLSLKSLYFKFSRRQTITLRRPDEAKFIVRNRAKLTAKITDGQDGDEWAESNSHK